MGFKYAFQLFYDSNISKSVLRHVLEVVEILTSEASQNFYSRRDERKAKH